MNRLWGAVFVVLFLFSNCTKQLEHKQPFFPDTIDGVTNFSLSNHTKEDLFSGNWEAPILMGKEKKKSRKISNESGTIKFTSVKPEKYILDTEFTSPDKIVNIILNGNKIEIKQRKKFLNGEKIITGKNSLSFIQKEGLKFYNISIYPKRILRIKGYEELIKDESILFLPGSLRFFVKAEKNEHINMKLDLNGKNSIKLKILLRSKNTEKEYNKKIKNGKSFKIDLLKGLPQEVLISFPLRKKGYLKITESYLVNRTPFNKTNRDKIKNIQGLVKNKNLLLILLDATRNDRTGYNGYNRDTTPNIDKFSEDSFIFNNCYSEASYTLASTGTLLTGLPPDFHGVISSFFSALNKKMTTIAKLFLKKGYFTAAVSANPNFSKAYRFNKGFQKFIELFLHNPVVMADEFIEPFNKVLDMADMQPFFIYLHLREPHDPFVMPQPYFSKFQNEYQETGDNVPISSFRASMGSYSDHKDLGSILGKFYDGNLAYGDMVFGKIINILKKRGLFSETTIVFLSDHGDALGEHGVFGHGHVLFQQSIRIPIVIKIPGVRGGVSGEQLITSDLVRTLNDIYALPFPYEEISYGHNIFSLPTVRRLVIRSINAFNYPGYSVIQYPYKLISHFPFNENTIQLYNLEKDPGEFNPVKGKPLVRKTLLFFLFNHLRTASNMNQKIVNPKLREKDIKALETLGYL